MDTHKVKKPCVQHVKIGNQGNQQAGEMSNMKNNIKASRLYQMLVENHQLKQENLALQKQIALIKLFINNPKRLKSVLNK